MSTVQTNAYRLANGAVCVHLSGAAEESRVPVHFVAVIDDSGSMGEDSKLERVVQSLDALLTYMGDEDMLSLVIFESSVKRPFTNCATTSDNKELVRAYLRTLTPLGGTNIASAIASLHEVLRGVPGGYKTGVLFLTDGEATVGITDDATLFVHVQTLLDTYAGTTVSAIGYGHDHRADLLRGMSVRGGGSYTIVTSVEQVASAFGDLLGGLRSCVAQEVRLLVPHSVTQMSAYSRRSDSQIFLGDLLAGGEHIVVLQGVLDTDVLTVEASDIRTGAPFPPMPVALGTANEEVGMRAYMRCAVVTLMEQVNRDFQGRHLNIADAVAEIDRISRQMATLPRHPLLDILQGQLERLRLFATAPPPPLPGLGRMQSNMLSQNTTSLGTARGVLSATDDDPTGISIFSSTTQRAISSGMSVAVAANNEHVVSAPPPLPIRRY